MGNIVEELIKGRDLTKQLQILMQMPCGDDVAVSQKKKLVDKIFGSLTEAIYAMSSGSSDNSGEVSDDRRSVDFGERNKRRAVKEGRGNYKRIKSSDSWIKISSSMVDEYSWRKYGQKETHNATYPRCYFRCTHKHDQGCIASKQVQKVQEQPIKYQITYFGHHTCRKTLQPNLENIILDSYPKESNLINFQLYTPTDIYPSLSWPNSIKEENKEVKSDLTSDELLSPSSSIPWPDLTPLMRFDRNENFLPGVHSYASSASYHEMSMDFFSECDDFTNHFESIYYNYLS